jgi:hypothetical protein
VVLAVVAVLTALILPAMGQVRENVHRVVCSSNQRQLGLAMFAYAADFKDSIPVARELSENGKPEELMAARGRNVGDWDGVGLLFSEGYCSAPDCFYCPSHHGEHSYEPDRWFDTDADPLYSNFHYAGHIEWDGDKRRRLSDGDRLVLLTDSFREPSDVNHNTGMNILRGDGSVRYFDDSAGQAFLSKVPGNGDQSVAFRLLWKEIEALPTR